MAASRVVRNLEIGFAEYRGAPGSTIRTYRWNIRPHLLATSRQAFAIRPHSFLPPPPSFGRPLPPVSARSYLAALMENVGFTSYRRGGERNRSRADLVAAAMDLRSDQPVKNGPSWTLYGGGPGHASTARAT